MTFIQRAGWFSLRINTRGNLINSQADLSTPEGPTPPAC